ncbi:MAG: dephospho-CoA kinase [Firmicutes bacterium]|nr:dephospho-CoA kinase [Bacillota bacterium]
MKVIGLTGGTGSGKSTVAAYLEKKGCIIIDADKISRDLTKPGGEALEPIRRRFGADVFFEDGSLDRKKLGGIVFSDDAKLRSLEEITTDIVIKKILEKVEHLKKNGFNGTVILDAPLLFECGMKDCTDENWLVTCDLENRIQRLIDRDGISRQSILDRMTNQLSDEQKRMMADRVIENSGSLTELYSRIDRFIERARDEK